MSDAANEDTGEPFDQTNGMADGLDGDADSPEQADKRTGSGDGNGVGFLAAPAPGAQLPGGVVPPVAGDEPGNERDAEDEDEPQAP